MSDEQRLELSHRLVLLVDAMATLLGRQPLPRVLAQLELFAATEDDAILTALKELLKALLGELETVC